MPGRAAPMRPDFKDRAEQREQELEGGSMWKVVGGAASVGFGVLVGWR